MEHQVSKEIPFTADATILDLIQYVSHVEVAYSPLFCEHQKERKSGNIQLVTEPTEEGEGKIDRIDVYKSIQYELKEKYLSQYWTIEGAASPQEEKADSAQDGDADDTQNTIRGIPVFQYGTLGLEVYPRDNDTIKLGTWDLMDMLQACLLHKPGQKVMPKLSGLASYEGTKKFRWSLRGPTIEPGSEAGSGSKRALKKFKTLFQK
ncbi:hypothetical protein Daus18300_007802 [Diaporthe australafricana]|uniref:Uncharacterized protein n=1 Tax=Diaporthe australafricana TaxID=127596 RepID=A0ABR3WKN0_9PEZI